MYTLNVSPPGFHPGGGRGGNFPPKHHSFPPKKKEGERGGEREREGGGREGEGEEREREGGEGGREREMWSLRGAILFVGGVREREEKIIKERERRNAICCMCRCHAHLPCTPKKFLDETLGSPPFLKVWIWACPQQHFQLHGNVDPTMSCTVG